ncbi:MAG: ABC transporter permease [Nitrospinae bacterium]|nr:ABC transporter permease [Nitrospinota bacterium]MBI3815344.1 ABC transporter permease [Nitrospinota bacterium]
MKLHKLLRFSFRNLFRNRRRTIITLSVAASGFAAMAIIAGYIDFTFYGLQELTIRNGFTGAGGTGHIQIFSLNALQKEESYPLEFGISDYEAITKGIQTIDGVFFAMPRIEFSGLISNGEKSLSFLGMGVDAKKEADLLSFFGKDMAMKLDNSALYALQDIPNGILLGKDMAKSLNAKRGDTLMLLSTTVDGAVNAIDVTVAGTITTGFKTADRYYLLTHISDAQRVMQTDKVSKIVAVLKDTEYTPIVIPEVSDILNRDFPSHKFAIEGWENLAEYYHAICDLYRIIFSFVGAVVVVIVTLSCTNTMLMSTMERIKEIGTLRAIGVSSKWVTAIFLLEGFLTGIGGVIIGTILKYIISAIINHSWIMMPPPPGMSISYQLQIYPATFFIPLIAIVIISSTTLSSLITLRKVRRISIVEAITHV